MLVSELPYKTAEGTNVAPAGTVKYALRLSWGYWEAKNTDDDLDEEIQKKFAKGYPQDNILLEDSRRLCAPALEAKARRWARRFYFLRQYPGVYSPPSYQKIVGSYSLVRVLAKHSRRALAYTPALTYSFS